VHAKKPDSGIGLDPEATNSVTNNFNIVGAMKLTK